MKSGNAFTVALIGATLLCQMKANGSKFSETLIIQRYTVNNSQSYNDEQGHIDDSLGFQVDYYYANLLATSPVIQDMLAVEGQPVVPVQEYDLANNTGMIDTWVVSKEKYFILGQYFYRVDLAGNGDPESPVISVFRHLPDAIVGVPYTNVLTTSAGKAPFSWKIASGQLPPGLNFDTNTATFSGTPEQTGNFFFQVWATDSMNRSAFKDLTLTVRPAPPTITTPSVLPSTQTDVSYQFQLTASGGTEPYTWNQIGNNMPSRLTLLSSGLIVGVASYEGTFTFTVRVTDATGLYSDKVFTITVGIVTPPAKPNLVPFTPPGWSGPIVVSDRPPFLYAPTDSASVYDDEKLYCYIGFKNASTTTAITNKFTVEISYKNGSAGAAQAVSGVRADDWVGWETSLISLSAGPVTITATLDSGGAVDESDKTDNVFSKTITVLHREPTVASTSFVPPDATGNGLFTMSFPTQAGKPYTIEAKDSLSASVWTAYQSFIGDGAIKTFSESVKGFLSHFFRINATPVNTVKFDFPVGPPSASLGDILTKALGDSDGWYVGEDFGEPNAGFANKLHHAEDWSRDDGTTENGAVFAAADGEVVYAEAHTLESGWGGIIVIRHDATDGTSFVLPSIYNYNGWKASTVWTMYAHLDSSRINDWVDTAGRKKVSRGQQIGVIGPKPYSSTAPHLHFEIKYLPYDGYPFGGGYSFDLEGWMSPSEFIGLNH